MNIQMKVFSAGLFFLFIFVFGFWLSRSGRPYNVLILTIHKLISLAAFIFLLVTIYQVNQVVSLSLVELTPGIVTSLFFVATFITGGLLSTDKMMPTAVLRLHQITPFLIVLSTAVTLYLLVVGTREIA